jgi:hypothetical protein
LRISDGLKHQDEVLAKIRVFQAAGDDDAFVWPFLSAVAHRMETNNERTTFSKLLHDLEGLRFWFNIFFL